MFSGVINLDKPAGLSSAGALNRIKRLLPRGTKLGHAGTLDPMATGVLLVLVGRCTKLCEVMMDQPKSYQATIRLGAVSATDDSDAMVELRHDAVRPAESALREALAGQVGSIEQRPPAYSALKLGGVPAYRRARGGQRVELQARTVRVDRLELLEYRWPLVQVAIDCGRGFYVRSLARDIGEALGTGGVLQALRRTAVGRYTAQSAVTLERLLGEGVERHLLAPPVE